MGVKDVLINEFIEGTEKLREMEVGTDERKALFDEITKLADQINELEKSENDKRDRLIKHGIGIATTGATLLTYWLAFIASTNFERTGSFTTKGGQSAIRELLTLKMKS